MTLVDDLSAFLLSILDEQVNEAIDLALASSYVHSAMHDYSETEETVLARC